MRVRRWKGPAAAQTCPCGVAADEWAYTGGDPTEKVEVTPGGVTVRFGTDPDYFQALCRSCHRKRDAPPLKTHCVNGHEFTPENTAYYKPPKRACRACAREKQRIYKARRKAAK